MGRGAVEKGFAPSGFPGYQWREECQREAKPLQASLVTNGERSVREGLHPFKLPWLPTERGVREGLRPFKLPWLPTERGVRERRNLSYIIGGCSRSDR